VGEERARIARELHDVVAHSVGAMVAQAQGARHVLDRDPERAREALETIERTGRTALNEMRRSLGVLRRPDTEAPLAPQPGMSGLGVLLEQARKSGLTVELVTEGEPAPLADGADLSAYRIVQEALTNTLKHAGPVHARVAVRYGERALEVEITDDGADGRAPNGIPSAGGGHGLVGMRERVALYGGDLHAGLRPEGGFVVRASLPLAP
jgi:signal transduction histidine kinase